jgi:hypothetical protein
MILFNFVMIVTTKPLLEVYGLSQLLQRLVHRVVSFVRHPSKHIVIALFMSSMSQHIVNFVASSSQYVKALLDLSIARDLFWPPRHTLSPMKFVDRSATTQDEESLSLNSEDLTVQQVVSVLADTSNVSTKVLLNRESVQTREVLVISVSEQKLSWKMLIDPTEVVLLLFAVGVVRPDETKVSNNNEIVFSCERLVSIYKLVLDSCKFLEFAMRVSSDKNSTHSFLLL